MDNKLFENYLSGILYLWFLMSGCMCCEFRSIEGIDNCVMRTSTFHKFVREREIIVCYPVQRWILPQSLCALTKREMCRYLKPQFIDPAYLFWFNSEFPVIIPWTGCIKFATKFVTPIRKRRRLYKKYIYEQHDELSWFNHARLSVRPSVCIYAN